jgi:probable blue pigment (indigoidine) exporter
MTLDLANPERSCRAGAPHATFALPYLAAVAPLIWGSTYLVATELLPPGRPLSAAAIRALPAGVLLAMRTRQLPDSRWSRRVACLGVLNIGAFFALLFVAAYRLPGGIAAVIGAMQPLIVIALSAIALRAPVAAGQLVAALAGAAGVAVLVLRSDARLDIVGVLAALGATACMATGTVLAKRWGRPIGVSLTTFTGWQLTVGGLFLLPLALLVEGVPSSLTAENVAGFLYLAVFGALLAYPLWFFGVDKLPASSASLLILLSPLMAMALGYVFRGERLSPLQCAGAVAVVFAVTAGQRVRLQEPAQ